MTSHITNIVSQNPATHGDGKGAQGPFQTFIPGSTPPPGLPGRCIWPPLRRVVCNGLGLLLAIAAFGPMSLVRAQEYTFATLAGSAGQSGTDNGTGNGARFNYPTGVAADNAGNAYVADGDSHTIRKVTPGGVVTTLAGSPGSSGTNDGTGSAARFLAPRKLAVDSAGTVYVADTGNATIRQITPGGVVTTLAGSPLNYGTNDGTGSAAQFTNPTGVGVDSAGNVYVADTGNHTIRKVTPAGVVTTLAGSPLNYGTNDGTGSAARFFYPFGLGLDAADNVYVADTANNTIRKVTPAGLVTTLAGLPGYNGTNDGTSTAARFNSPYGLAVDTAANVYVADSFSHTIRKMTPAGVVTTIAGSPLYAGSNDGPGSVAQFNSPRGVAVDTAGNVYVTDSLNHTLRIGRPPPPIIVASSLARTNGQFSFTIQSLPGSAVEIHASPDLSNWSSIATLTNLTGTAAFSDPATNFQRRFYRLRQL